MDSRPGARADLAIEFAAALPSRTVACGARSAGWGRQRFCRPLSDDSAGCVLGTPHAAGRAGGGPGNSKCTLAPLVEQRRADPGDDLISRLATLEREDGPVTAQDLVATLVEVDLDTMHGSLANLWFRLLEQPERLQSVLDEPRFLKLAVLETFRHSAPILQAMRFARHEVERFGRLIPEGGAVICSAAAGNRDPRVFADPDTFIVNRKDLCHRRGARPIPGRRPGNRYHLWPGPALQATGDTRRPPAIAVRDHPQCAGCRVAGVAQFRCRPKARTGRRTLPDLPPDR